MRRGEAVGGRVHVVHASRVEVHGPQSSPEPNVLPNPLTPFPSITARAVNPVSTFSPLSPPSSLNPLNPLSPLINPLIYLFISRFAWQGVLPVKKLATAWG